MIPVTVIGVATLKGGAGKSTLAGMLAPLLAGIAPVIILDADHLRAMLDWFARRGADPAIRAFAISDEADLERKLAQIHRQLAGRRAWVLIDVPGNAPAMMKATARLCDILIIPTKTSRLDLRGAIESVALLLGECAGPPVEHAIVLVDAAPRREGVDAPDVRYAREVLHPAGGRVWRGQITRQVAIPRAFKDGRSIVETDPDGEGAAEIRALFRMVLARLAVD